MGNAVSIIKMIQKAGGEAVLCNSPETLSNSSAIIMPGVGSFDNAMDKLRSLGFIEAFELEVIQKRTPFLGICLGMQLLFEQSEEGNVPGLGWLDGNVVMFKFSELSNADMLKVPHMGWNYIHPANTGSLFSGYRDEIRFYFTHSYHVDCFNKKDILATTNYGYKFVSSVQRGHIFGVQFHPEKSHRFGIQFFKNFLKEVRNA